MEAAAWSGLTSTQPRYSLEAMRFMSTTSSPPLLTPVDRLPGVGSPLARLLERLGLRTAADLLFNFPRRYEDYT
jgi:ATP-dependent DNA helicase RecG